MKKKRIIITGGGTGGHIFPLLAVVKEIKKKDATIEIFYIGPKDKWSQFLEKEGIKILRIPKHKIRRGKEIKELLLNIRDVFLFLIALLKAFFHLYFLFPGLIFSKGGPGSLAVTLAGRFLLIPVFLHESDAVIGFSNRIAQKWALEVFTSFPETEGTHQEKRIVVGNPIRDDLIILPPNMAKKEWKIPTERKVILLLGGSQGSQRLNDTIILILKDLLQKYVVIHQTGERNISQIKKETNILLTPEEKRFYFPKGFLTTKELSEALSMADLVIARAGASTIFEIAFFGKPAILIPLASAAQNHQVKNAYQYASFGACQVIEEKNLTPNFLLERINDIILNPVLKERMREGALRFARPKAGKIIAEYLVEYLNSLVSE